MTTSPIDGQVFTRVLEDLARDSLGVDDIQVYTHANTHTYTHTHNKYKKALTSSFFRDSFLFTFGKDTLVSLTLSTLGPAYNQWKNAKKLLIFSGCTL